MIFLQLKEIFTNRQNTMNTLSFTRIPRTQYRRRVLDRCKLTVVNKVNLKSLNDNQFGYYVTELEIKNNKIPKSFFKFAIDNLKKEVTRKRYGQKLDPYENKTRGESMKILRMRQQLKKLELNNQNIWKREQASNDIVKAPRIMMAVYHLICYFLDILFDGKPIERFWFLETVARMPYFSYVTMLQLYETLGWWEIDGPLKTMHTDEEINETKHLRIMESLGGNLLWWNRFLAIHGALVYYVVLIFFYLVSPKYAYLSSELLERHAVYTYTEFYESNEKILKQLEPTREMLDYDLYCESFYDIFTYIAADELGHARSMRYVQKLTNEY